MQIKSIAYIALLMWVASCAQIMPLDGGPKDVRPPAIDSATTIPYNGVTYFKGQEIQIGFNEYIKLNNPKENILITPIPDTMPEFKLKNKLLTIKFLKALRPETTYSIFIYGAVVDLTEGNDSLYQFVFSTGSKIDSSRVCGQVKSAFTNQPVSDVMVGLYPNQDSAVFKVKPRYIARTDKAGYYSMGFVKPGEYRIFALQDANKTYTVDQIEEPLAFENEAVTVSDSSFYSLMLYQQEDLRQFIKKSEYSYPGRVSLVLNQPEKIERLQITPLDNWYLEETNREDSFFVWLPPDPKNILTMVVKTPSIQDTVTVDRYVKKGSEKNIPLTVDALQKGVVLSDTLQLMASLPITEVDTDRIYLFQDSIPTEFELIYQKGQRKLSVVASFQTEKNYRLVLDSASVNDIFGQLNDSISFQMERKGAAYFGKLIVSFDSLAVQQGFIELYTSAGVVAKQKVAQRMEFDKIPPGNYEMRLVQDPNNNFNWDTGNYGLGRQPEKVIYHNESINIKSNWDLEINWDLQSKSQLPKSPQKGINR